MGKVWRFLLDLGGLLPWAVPIVIGVLAWLQQMPWYLIALSVIAAVGLVFFGINQFETWKERHKKGFSTQSNENIESILRKWLDKRQYSSQHKTIENNLFYFVVTDKQNRPINIMRPEDNPAVIRLLLALDEKELEAIPVKQQNVLRFRTGVEMARFGLLFHAEKPMYVYLDLPCDDLLTEHIFLNAVDKIRQSLVLMAFHIGAVLAAIRAQEETLMANETNSGNKESQN